MEDPAVDRVREIIMGLPDVQERISHDAPAWFLKGKRQIASIDDHHAKDRLAIWFAAPPGLQESLIAEDPQRFFRPPYVGPAGWVGMQIDGHPDWAVVAEMLEIAHGWIASLVQKKPRA
jgi:hypothetical protein